MPAMGALVGLYWCEIGLFAAHAKYANDGPMDARAMRRQREAQIIAKEAISDFTISKTTASGGGSVQQRLCAAATTSRSPGFGTATDKQYLLGVTRTTLCITAS